MDTYEGKWTFSKDENSWEHDTYETKEEAIEVAIECFENDFFIGQLEFISGLNYKVINQEKITFSLQ